MQDPTKKIDFSKCSGEVTKVVKQFIGQGKNPKIALSIILDDSEMANEFAVAYWRMDDYYIHGRGRWIAIAMSTEYLASWLVNQDFVKSIGLLSPRNKAPYKLPRDTVVVRPRPQRHSSSQRAGKSLSQR